MYELSVVFASSSWMLISNEFQNSNFQSKASALLMFLPAQSGIAYITVVRVEVFMVVMVTAVLSMSLTCR